MAGDLGGTVNSPGAPGAQPLEGFGILLFQVFLKGVFKGFDPKFTAKKVIFVNCLHHVFWLTSNCSSSFKILVLGQAAII